MKTTLTTFSLLFASAVMISSCATNKMAANQRSAEIRSSKELAGFFVTKKDGNTQYYNSLELVKGAFTSPHLLADGKIKIKSSDIVAYQTTTHYAVSQALFSNGRKSFVSKEALPGFAVRVVKGKLNVYCKKYFNGNAAVDEFYIQSGNDGKISLYSADLMQKMIAENDQALNYFNDTHDKVAMAEKIQNAAAIYNNKTAVTKN